MKSQKEEGSVLVLVIIGALILSLIGIAGLRTTSTELVIARNFQNDKTAFFVAESGINFGINELRESIDPTSVSFLESLDRATYKSGPVEESAAQTIQAFLPIPAPTPQGVSMEVGGDTGIVATAWDLLVSSEYKTSAKYPARKEIRTVILVMSTEY